MARKQCHMNAILLGEIKLEDYCHKFHQYKYSGTSNSGHFGGPSLVTVALEVTDVWRFYMNILFLSKRLVGRNGRSTKNDSSSK